MVKHPWPLLEISLSDFRRLATLNINTYLPTIFFTSQVYMTKHRNLENGVQLHPEGFSTTLYTEGIKYLKAVSNKYQI